MVPRRQDSQTTRDVNLFYIVTFRLGKKFLSVTREIEKEELVRDKLNKERL